MEATTTSNLSNTTSEYHGQGKHTEDGGGCIQLPHHLTWAGARETKSDYREKEEFEEQKHLDESL